MLINFNKKNLLFYPCFVLLLFCTNLLVAQSWEKTYGGNHWENSEAVIADEDGGFTVIGTTESFGQNEAFEGQGLFDIYVIKTDIDGKVLWQQTYGNNGVNIGVDLIATADKGYLLLGNTTNPSNGQTDIILIKIDQSGHALWTRTYGEAKTETAVQLLSTTSNDFFILGESNSASEELNVLLIKIDSEGEALWTKTYEEAGIITLGGGLISPEENIIITGQTFSEEASGDLFSLKINPDGDPVGFQTYDFGGLSMGQDITNTADGNFVITGTVSSATEGIFNQMLLLKITPEGDSLWSATYGDGYSQVGMSIQELASQDLLIAGYGNNFSDNQDIFLIKTNAEGGLIWQQNYGGSNGESCHDLILSQYQTPIIAGFTFSFDRGFGDMYLLHTDTLGQTLQQQISGQVIFDSLQNCQLDTFILNNETHTEQGLSNWIITAANIHSNRLYYGSTDNDGRYKISTDTGTYMLYLHRPNNYWQSCRDSQSVHFMDRTDTIVDFFVQAERNCPLLEVDISTPILRPGYPNTYNIQYRNQGTSTAENVRIEVTLDPLLRADDFSIAPIAQDGQNYVFDVGELGVNGAGRFHIQTVLDTFAYLGQTHCTTAHILPDSLCLPIDTTIWDGSSVAVEGRCEADSVKFFIKNVGVGDMENDLQFFVIEDDIIVFFGTFDVDAGKDTLIGFPATGQTYHLRAEQSPGHPGISTPNATIETCEGSGGSAISLGFVTQFPEDDGNPFVSIDCQPNVSSFDPNDKQGFPKGVGMDRCIAPNTDLEYLIRFQNTGTDTAFLVVIRDTIAAHLDLTSIRAGASSHPYKMNVYGTGAIKFTFENIMLPDSNANEVASHGFVKFRIAQQKDNPIGTLVENSAGIYFDFNAPVITNQTSHRIDTMCLDVMTATIDIPKENNIITPVKVFPNPSDGQVNFEIVDNISDTYQLHVYKLTGEEVYRGVFSSPIFQINCTEQVAGMYVYKITTSHKQAFFGKMIVY